MHRERERRAAAMLVIGLTGGIAAGKTLVSDRFAALGIPVVDADVLAREVVTPGSEGAAAVVAELGPELLDADGALDRARLRQRIFADDDARQRLEAILHPRIRARMDALVDEARRSGAPYCITAVPLLVETGQDAQCDRVLVVDAPEEVQLARLQARDGGDAATARAVLARQSSRWARLQRADDVIDNGDGASPETGVEPQVRALDRKYRRLAERGPASR